MTKHPTSVNYEGSLTELANEIGNLRYDALAEFLTQLSEKVKKDAEADANRGRIMLSFELDAMSCLIDNAAETASAAWEICKPHVKE